MVVDGHDTKTRFFEFEPGEMKRRLKDVVDHVTKACGGNAKSRKWVALYGGIDDQNKYVAHVGACCGAEFGVPVVAVQCDEFERDDHHAVDRR